MKLEEVLKLAALGMHVHPLHDVASGRCSCGEASCDKQGKNPGKHPRTKHGLKDATQDEAKIKRWHSRWPDANWGIRTGSASGLLVVDVDVKDGKHGDDTLHALEAEHGELPEGPRIKTGSGGEHRYFKAAEGKRSAIRVRGLAFAVDGL